MDEIFKAILHLKDYCYSRDQCYGCDFFNQQKGVCELSYKKPRYWSCSDTIIKGLSTNKEGD